jgi:hypothetical protein
MENFDKPQRTTFSGQALMQTGLEVKLEPHSSAVFCYRRIKP